MQYVDMQLQYQLEFNSGRYHEPRMFLLIFYVRVDERSETSGVCALPCLLYACVQYRSFMKYAWSMFEPHPPTSPPLQARSKVLQTHMSQHGHKHTHRYNAAPWPYAWWMSVLQRTQHPQESEWEEAKGAGRSETAREAERERKKNLEAEVWAGTGGGGWRDARGYSKEGKGGKQQCFFTIPPLKNCF